ncbi:hypothetical protein [Idiomarina seosinensis]|uniref:Uncharacterized protein n=1 Tax=Idiomarina seosinensis TaxID=281739 RepID=A0A432ZHF1_9GAMM|nr:hypothetical protein [Idiomarina seosinensis]RUO77359.1 hypothetical protein CWI81_02425 [Idiomarina seosinensis]
MHRFRPAHPHKLLSISDDGEQWLLNEQQLQLCGKALVLWRWAVIVPLAAEPLRQRHWLWLWWFQLPAQELALIRLLASCGVRY